MSLRPKNGKALFFVIIMILFVFINIYILNFQIYPKILLRIVVELELHYLCVNIVLCYWVCGSY